MTKVKICGLKDLSSLNAAIEAGADFIGFVFYPKSPRAISTDTLEELVPHIPSHVVKVGLFVDPSDEDLAVAPLLDMIQLHGAETPERCAEVKALTDKMVMKAIGISDKDDLVQIRAYDPVCDWLLLDAKPVNEGDLPGGNGLRFDWTLLEDMTLHTPWMLAGGLTPDNVKAAIDLVSPDAVDVSSGVEDRPGVKSVEKITRFIDASKVQILT